MWRVLLLIGVAMSVRAQTPAAVSIPIPDAVPGAEPVTLRTYVNLVQIPVLVLTEKKWQPVLPVAADRFTLSIDSGPKFAAKHVRLEGSDPIRLILLLDERPRTRSMIAGVEVALRQLIPMLGPDDRVSLVVLRGGKLSSMDPLPPTERAMARFGEMLQKEVPWPADPVWQPGTAAPPLWDGIALTLLKFRDSRARRVLVVLTDGEDAASRTTLNELHDDADLEGAAIFALRDRAPKSSALGSLRQRQTGETWDPLAMLTERTGGLTLNLDDLAIGDVLARVLAMVRGRYILEFVRPSKLTVGSHELMVKVKGPPMFVRWSGLEMPLPDPKIAADPHTLPSNSVEDPPVGSRRPIRH